MTFMLDSGPRGAPARLLLAHGAGANVESPFMTAIAQLLSDRGLWVTRFEFPYMSARREGGARRPPPRAEALTAPYADLVRDVCADLRKGQSLAIGGKSLGGRVASMIADDAFAAGQISALVCLGYPFHPPGKPDSLRTAHLTALKCPALIVQGERDPFGTQKEVEEMTLSSTISFCWMGDGDHDFGPRGASGFTRKGNLASAADAVAAFLLDPERLR